MSNSKTVNMDKSAYRNFAARAGRNWSLLMTFKRNGVIQDISGDMFTWTLRDDDNVGIDALVGVVIGSQVMFTGPWPVVTAPGTYKMEMIRLKADGDNTEGFHGEFEIVI